MKPRSKGRPDRGERYSKVSRRIWNDAKFRELTPIPPCGQGLVFRLLTAPECSVIPGLFQAWEAGLAQSLGWTLKAFREAFAEASTKGIVKADWSVGLVWLPNAVKHNEPQSPNVVISWAKEWPELPECPLKDEAGAFVKGYLEGMGEAFAKAFAKALPEGSAHPSPNQEQDQDQEQEQDQETPRPPQGVECGSAPPPPISTPTKPVGTTEDLRARAQHYLDHECDGRACYGPAESWPAVRDVIDCWKAEWGGSEIRIRGGLRDPRLRVVLERFSEGYSPEQLCAAVRGARRDTFTASNRNASKLDSVLRDAARVDKFVEFLEEPSRESKRSTGICPNQIPTED